MLQKLLLPSTSKINLPFHRLLLSLPYQIAAYDGSVAFPANLGVPEAVYGCCSPAVQELRSSFMTTYTYRVVDEIGEGTFGRVYRAVRLPDGLVVVLKKILVRRPDQGLPKAVLREIQAYHQVQHVHVLRLLDHYATSSSVVLVLDAMRCDLHQVLRKLNRALTEAEIKVSDSNADISALLFLSIACAGARFQGILRMVLSGLGAIHQAGIIHRVSSIASRARSKAKAATLDPLTSDVFCPPLTTGYQALQYPVRQRGPGEDR